MGAAFVRTMSRRLSVATGGEAADGDPVEPESGDPEDPLSGKSLFGGGGGLNPTLSDEILSHGYVAK